MSLAPYDTQCPHGGAVGRLSRRRRQTECATWQDVDSKKAFEHNRSSHRMRTNDASIGAPNDGSGAGTALVLISLCVPTNKEKTRR